MILKAAALSLTLFGASMQTPHSSSGPTFGNAPPRVASRDVPPLKEIPIQPCVADVLDHTEPGVIYKLDSSVTPPKITQDVDVKLTEEGREAYLKNLFKDPNEVISRISVLIDSQGKPTTLCLAKAAGFDLDQHAANAVLQYRFKAAHKDGKPVAMRIVIEIRYVTH